MDEAVWPGDRIEALIAQHRSGARQPGWSAALLDAVGRLDGPMDPVGRAALGDLTADLRAGLIPADALLADVLTAVAEARAHPDGPQVAGPVPAAASADGLDLEVVWIGGEFTVARAGTEAAFEAASADWEAVSCVGDLLPLLTYPEQIWSFVDEDDLEAAGLDPDVFEDDPSVLPADMPLESGRVFGVAGEHEWLPDPPHYGEAAEDLLELLPPAVADLARVGGASPMNAENFVTFDAADVHRVVGLLLEAGHRVTDPGRP